MVLSDARGSHVPIRWTGASIPSASALPDADQLVGLQAQLPLRMGEAEADRPGGVGGARRTVHRLQREAAEFEPGIVERVEPLLRRDDLQLVAGGDLQRGPGLR